ncbi:hypothetical protein CEXT_448891 [Caerostris extrusa]|uniref:Uncharacterized protein n=1 Tax=Caerostris extrusa TaxID=172846 RepID=A0AAV4PJ95_CAEEX|nr:hypothetical protein CEXT_448891 [Caerostris extrusa]
MTSGARALPGLAIRWPHYLISVSLQGERATRQAWRVLGSPTSRQSLYPGFLKMENREMPKGGNLFNNWRGILKIKINIQSQIK